MKKLKEIIHEKEKEILTDLEDANGRAVKLLIPNTKNYGRTTRVHHHLWKRNAAISPEKGKLEPLKPGDEEPLQPGEDAKAATERLEKAYADKGKEENARGQKL